MAQRKDRALADLRRRTRRYEPLVAGNRRRHFVGESVHVVWQHEKGNRPSYTRSARPEIAVPLYEKFIARLTQDLGRTIYTGEFGADMLVSLSNDGPVTIIIDSKTKE